LILLGVWLAASLVIGACWVLAGWLLGERRARVIDARTREVEAEDEAA